MRLRRRHRSSSQSETTQEAIGSNPFRPTIPKEEQCALRVGRGASDVNSAVFGIRGFYGAGLSRKRLPRQQRRKSHRQHRRKNRRRAEIPSTWLRSLVVKHPVHTRHKQRLITYCTSVQIRAELPPSPGAMPSRPPVRSNLFP